MSAAAIPVATQIFAPQRRMTGVLVVEDHDRQSVPLMEALRGFGYEAVRARNAHEAIRIAALERPSVIFLDGLLPGMHGFEAARFIRHIDSDYRPYIAMTTAIYKGVSYKNEAALKYGIDEYLIKPVPAEAVCAVLRAAGMDVQNALEGAIQ